MSGWILAVMTTLYVLSWALHMLHAQWQGDMDCAYFSWQSCNKAISQRDEHFQLRFVCLPGLLSVTQLQTRMQLCTMKAIAIYVFEKGLGHAQCIQ
jgi:hypothetical protein